MTISLLRDETSSENGNLSLDKLKADG